MSDTRFQNFETLRELRTEATVADGEKEDSTSVTQQFEAEKDTIVTPEATTYILDLLTPKRALPSHTDQPLTTQELIVAFALEDRSIHTVAELLGMTTKDIEAEAAQIRNTLKENIQAKRSRLPDPDNDPILADIAEVYDKLLAEL